MYWEAREVAKKHIDVPLNTYRQIDLEQSEEEEMVMLARRLVQSLKVLTESGRDAEDLVNAIAELLETRNNG